MRKSIYVLFSVILLLGILAGCGTKGNQTAKNSSNGNKNTEATSGDVWKRIQDKGVLRVGFEGTYPPFNYQDDSGELTGFDVDISKEIASRLGVKVEFITSKWAGLIGGLNADKFDTIIAQMTVTDERKKSVDFTDPYIVTGAVIVTHNDTNNIKTLEDLKGKKVGAAAGTSFADLAKQAKGADVKLYDGGFSTYVNDVVNKRLDALVNDSLVMGYNIKKSGLPIKVTSELLSRDENAMAIKKGNEDFVKKMNEKLGEIKEDGTYEKIYMKWFGMKPLE
ncbi:transporter substrate-binding domain-containing protein [Rummeliibacillus pycnus]|uniref:transporter substrate-binding domain-containing protein n=1 Tax=Rummeliibacillus pycnus TaxID=101070 RepID=UPI003D2DC656